MAVDPGWPLRPYAYFQYTHSTERIRISRFTVTGTLSNASGLLSIDPASRYDVISDLPDNTPYHNSGTLRFGPDGMLYSSIGEDNNPTAAQDTASLRGMILRLDVSRLPSGAGSATHDAITPPDNPYAGVGGRNSRLVWSYGLRNPFRFCIDAWTGHVMIGEVGNEVSDELDEITAAPQNFGWPRYEANAIYDPSAPLNGPATAPIMPLAHATHPFAVIGGVYYHRPASAQRGFPPDYEGDYLFSEYFSGAMWRLNNDGAWKLADPAPGQPSTDHWAQGLVSVADYAVGPDGALWYCKQSTAPHAGQIRRIVGNSTAAVPGAEASGVSFARPFPRPSSGAVELRWTLPAPARVVLAIHDVTGRRLCTLLASELGPGSFHATWNGETTDGRRVDPGLYFARLRVGDRTYQHRLAIVR